MCPYKAFLNYKPFAPVPLKQDTVPNNGNIDLKGQGQGIMTEFPNTDKKITWCKVS